MSVIGSIDPNKTVTIYGAGISGLILAYELKKKNIRVRVKEKTNQIGGKLKTERVAYGLIEKSANAIYANNPVIELLQELELKPIRSNSNLKRLIFHKNKVKQSPVSKWQLSKALLKSLKSIPESAKSKDATLYDFLVPLLGHDISFNIVSSGLFGVYASNSQQLHRSVLFKYDKFDSSYRKYFMGWLKQRKEESKDSGKPISISFEGGMSDLIKSLGMKLEEDIQLNSEDTIADDNSIVCTDAHCAANLLRIGLLKDIDYQKIYSTTFFSENEIPDLKDAFGVLFSPESHYSCLGILNNTAIFTREETPNTQSYTVISKNENAESDLKKLYPDIKILDSQSEMWERAIPVYNFKRIEVIENSRQRLSGNQAFFGNYTGSLSLREIILEAKKFATSLAEK